MARKVIQKYIQGRIFDDDEVINVRKRTKKYNDYVQGARDMFLKFMSVEDHERESIKHLPKSQMEALISSILKDEDFLRKFLSGYKVTFDIERDEDNNVKSVKPILHKKTKLSERAIEVLCSCTTLNEEGIEKTLRLNRAYIVNEIREFFGAWSYSELCPLIEKFVRRNDYEMREP